MSEEPTLYRAHPDAPAWERQPWEQRPTESAPAYAAFLAYRDLGSGRSLVKVGRTLGKHDSLLERWSVAHEWVVRALAWDQHTQQAADARKLAEREQMVERHGQAAAVLLNLAVRAMQPRPLLDDRGQPVMRRNPDGTAEPAMVPPSLPELRGAATALREATHLQRLAAGLPTSVTDATVTLRREVEAADEFNNTILRVLEEHLCDECRDVILTTLRRLAPPPPTGLDSPGLRHG